MNIGIIADGKQVVNIEINLGVISELLGSAARSISVAVYKSVGCTAAQMADFISRVDPRTVQLLRRIALDETGSIPWCEARKIFGINDPSDWSAFSGSFGKGITRAYRHVLKNTTARLVWSNDDTWDEEDWDDEGNRLWIDGPALDALREVVNAA